LPWDHLDSGLEKAWLWEDWQDALAEKELDDCRWSPCYDCGVCPGLSIQHDTGYTGGFQLPVLPSNLGGGTRTADRTRTLRLRLGLTAGGPRSHHARGGTP
jgi:hypothetical protein